MNVKRSRIFNYTKSVLKLLFFAAFLLLIIYISIAGPKPVNAQASPTPANSGECINCTWISHCDSYYNMPRVCGYDPSTCCTRLKGSACAFGDHYYYTCEADTCNNGWNCVNMQQQYCRNAGGNDRPCYIGPGNEGNCCMPGGSASPSPTYGFGECPNRPDYCQDSSDCWEFSRPYCDLTMNPLIDLCYGTCVAQSYIQCDQSCHVIGDCPRNECGSCPFCTSSGDTTCDDSCTAEYPIPNCGDAHDQVYYNCTHGTLDCANGGDCFCCKAPAITPRLTMSPLCGVDSIRTAIGCIPVGNQNDFLVFILRWAIGIAGGASFLLIVYSGFLIMTAGGDKRKLQSGKELLTAALSGLMLIIFSIFILDIIGIRIFRLPGFS
jgi:hypothetical protein